MTKFCFAGHRPRTVIPGRVTRRCPDRRSPRVEFASLKLEVGKCQRYVFSLMYWRRGELHDLLSRSANERKVMVREAHTLSRAAQILLNVDIVVSCLG